MPRLRFFLTPQGVIFSVWAAASVLAGAVLTSFHQPFNLPQATLASVAAPHEGWRVLHLLTEGCGCSKGVAGYLVKRGPLEGASEQVLFVDAEDPFQQRAALLRRGFAVSSIDAVKLRAQGVAGVPLLVFLDPAGRVAYQGGYGIGGYKDADLWPRIRRGEAVKPLPVLGCAIGRSLRSQVDPFSWKYR